MKIFIRSQGDAFDRQTLERFVRAGLRGPWYTGFRQRGEVVTCRILRVMDQSGRRVEYHGLVEVRPTNIGWSLIQRMDGKNLHGKPVRVRKWFDRAGPTADRRHIQSFQQISPEKDRRRVSDRRRMVRVQLLADLPQVIARQSARARH